MESQIKKHPTSFTLPFLLILLIAILSFTIYLAYTNNLNKAPKNTLNNSITLKTNFTPLYPNNNNVNNYPINISSQIESTESGKIKGTLTFSNTSDKSYSDLYYAVLLLSPQKLSNDSVNGKSTNLIIEDKLAYSESSSFSIKNNETKKFSFEIPYSQHIKPDKYNLTFSIISNLGQYFGFTTDSINLNGSGDLLTVDQSSCKVIVGGVEFDPVLAPLLDKNGQVQAKCNFTNTSPNILNLKYKIDFGVLYDIYYPQSKKTLFTPTDTVIFNPGETKSVIFNLPTNLDPQVYESYITFIDPQNQPQSPMELFRWTISGPSGRIESISLDNDYYQKGDIAKVSTVVDPSMDLYWRFHPSSNNTNVGTDLRKSSLLVTITDQNNNICGQGQQALPRVYQPSWGKLDVSVTIQNDCINPKAEIKIIDSGNILAVASQENPTSSSKLAILSKNSQNLPAVLAIGLLVVAVILIIIFYIRGGKLPHQKVLIIFFSLGISFFILKQGGIEVKALTIKSPPSYLDLSEYQCGGCYSGSCDPDVVYDLVNTNFNASISFSGSTANITLYGTPAYAANESCGNIRSYIIINGPGLPSGYVTLGVSTNTPWSYSFSINNPSPTLTYTFVGWFQSANNTQGYWSTYSTYAVVDLCSAPPTNSNVAGAQEGQVSLNTCHCITDPSTICSGTHYADSCGNNVCTGTQAPVCNGSNTCQGQTASGTCGSTCAGTKVCDTTPPVTAVLNFPSSACYSPSSWGASQNIQFSATDDLTGIASADILLSDTSGGSADQTFSASLISGSTYQASIPSSALVAGKNYKVYPEATDGAGQRTSKANNNSTPSNSFLYNSSCVSPFIQTNQGDVHSNTNISTPGGP